MQCLLTPFLGRDGVQTLSLAAAPVQICTPRIAAAILALQLIKSLTS